MTSPVEILFQTDAYKLDHRRQYGLAGDVTRVYSNYTNRKSRIEGFDHVVHFGLQAYLHKLDAGFRRFFEADKDAMLLHYFRRVESILGPDAAAAIGTDHIAALHELGYLPLKFNGLPEGTLVPIRVPSLTVENTHPDFYWLTNYIETGLSASIWHPSTAATIAHAYRVRAEEYSRSQGLDGTHLDFQVHDFSYRGMSSNETAAATGAAHLLSFKGSDTLCAADFIERYYGGPFDLMSVAATEHSVMSTGIMSGVSGWAERPSHPDKADAERDLFRRLLNLYPTGIVSVVSDTFNLWNVLEYILPALKSQVLARDGKLVIRPDSGDPVKIICGNPAGRTEIERKGVIEGLWDVFGGITNEYGLRILEPHIGAIYGDSITLDRAEEIWNRLEGKGFAANNIVFGVGSYCTHPDTKVLCADLVWRKAKSLKVGQEIIAFDEDPVFGTDGPSRGYRKAVVEMNEPGRKDSLKVRTDRGDIMVTTDHPFLVFSKNRSVETIFASGVLPEGVERRNVPRGPGLIWKRAIDLELGDQIAFFGEPWKTDETRNGGWLAGLFDGEGCVSKSSGINRIAAWKVNLSQNEGLVLQQAKDLLAQRGYTWYLNERKCQQVVLNGGWRETLRFLGSIRPGRLLDNCLDRMLADMPKLKAGSTYDLATVTALSDVYKEEISSIRTSARTMITNGFLSHNTYQYNTRDTFGSAMKATWAEVNGRGVNLFKDPITDDGTKRSATGRLAVLGEPGDLYLVEEASSWAEQQSKLGLIWQDGVWHSHLTFEEVRDTLTKQREVLSGWRR